MNEKVLLTDTMEQTANIFGNFDMNTALIEKAFDVSITNRESQTTAGDAIVVRGEDGEGVKRAYDVLEYLKGVAARGNEITEQTVDYIIGTVKGGEKLELFGDDCICVTTQGKPIKARTVGQKKYIDLIRKNTIVFGIGPAGTGKTFLAVAAASTAFRNKEVSRIILTRPAVEAGEKLGFLPGDLQMKIDPYLRPLYDALFEMFGAETYQKHIERGSIEIAPLAYMRGRTLDDSFIILDEAQNTTPEQMKMFLTRLGSGSRAIITGDITQVDLPFGKKSGLTEAIKILRGIDDIAIHEFNERDVVRHKLVQKIVVAYDKYERETRIREEAKKEEQKQKFKIVKRNQQ
ncbi:MAG: PhoH family protein [Clostridia bacterium]|nr:PhoH family protein [Clostridia bacterium]MBQ9745668.1 PhoH family protein [Clostridia bacterium]